jgi:hypothetical protein
VLAIRVLVAALRLLKIGLLRAMGLLLVRVPVWSWGLLNPVWHRICVRTFDGLLLSLLGLRRSIHALGLLRLRGPLVRSESVVVRRDSSGRGPALVRQVLFSRPVASALRAEVVERVQPVGHTAVAAGWFFSLSA